MEKLTEDDNLLYKIDTKEIYIKDFFNFNRFSKTKTLEIIGNNFTINRKEGIVKYKLDSIEFDTFLTGISYNLIEKNKKGKFYSYTHLEKLLNKYKYKNPVYLNNDTKILNPLLNIRDINGFQFLTEITISESKDNEDIITNLYKELTKIYNSDISLEDNININELSPNFKYYFIKNKNDFKNKNIPIFFSSKRNNIVSDILNFVDKNNKQKIYALCGPFGIGKSFTSLLIQKYLFYDKYPTLYINLSTSENINDLKMIIIRELFFLFFEEKNFISVSKKILNTIIYDIWGIIIMIDEFCDKNNINYLLILDQYQKLTDELRQLNSLKAKKIFLLSSINDDDVKMNLITQIKKEEIPPIQYKYLISLFKNPKEEILESLKIKDNNTINILKFFNYLPVSFFLLEYVYDWNILDFINHQFYLTLIKLTNFFQNKNINIISYLKSNKLINKTDDISKQSISINYFLEIINDIPLKYIVYELSEQGFLHLTYAFDYVIIPLKCVLNFINSKTLFKSKQDAYLKGGEFEDIIKYKIIYEKTLFEVDAFVEVNEIIKMDLVNEYRFIKIEDIKNKTSVFIYQENYRGEDYDFSILKPKEGVIILFQAKYKINENNIKNKEYYSDKKSINKIINIIKEKFNIIIKKIYLLYISSFEFNKRDSVFKILKSNRINCIFYSITDDYFSFDCANIINKLELNSSYEIYPESQHYTECSYIKAKRIEQITSTFIKEEQDNLIKSGMKIENTFLKNEYEQILKYTKASNIYISKHIGPFVFEYSKNFMLFPKVYFDYYLLFFNITKKKTIDYSKDIIILYEESYIIKYYNLFTKKSFSSEQFRKIYKNYYYTFGYWKKDDTMNLHEE